MLLSAYHNAQGENSLKTESLWPSQALQEKIENWARNHCHFPVDKLAQLKNLLLSKNFRAAHDSLEVRYSGITSEYENNRGPIFFINWRLESKGPPKARAMIYRFLSRNHLETVEIKPEIGPFNVVHRSGLNVAIRKHAFLPEELESIKEEMIKEAQRAYNSEVRCIEFTFQKIETYQS